MWGRFSLKISSNCQIDLHLYIGNVSILSRVSCLSRRLCCHFSASLLTLWHLFICQTIHYCERSLLFADISAPHSKWLYKEGSTVLTLLQHTELCILTRFIATSPFSVSDFGFCFRFFYTISWIHCQYGIGITKSSVIVWLQLFRLCQKLIWLDLPLNASIFTSRQRSCAKVLFSVDIYLYVQKMSIIVISQSQITCADVYCRHIQSPLASPLSPYKDPRQVHSC